MKRIAVFPGTFDPVTLGHQDIVQRAAALFDEVIVAIGHNTTKQTMFSLEQRMGWLNQVFKSVHNVKVESFEGLTVEFCRSRHARYLLRGLRNTTDLEYERTIAHMNSSLDADVETVLMFTSPQLSSIHSTVIREIVRNRGDVSSFVPKEINVYEK